MADNQWVRYELCEQSQSKALGWRRVASTNETDEAKAIAELQAKAKDLKGYTDNLRGFIDVGPRGKMRIQRCDVRILVDSF